MVIGPTADDDTMLCLKTYWDGLYGAVGSLEAKRILLNNLEVENLGIQYFIGKQEVVDHVINEYEGSGLEGYGCYLKGVTEKILKQSLDCGQVSERNDLLACFILCL